MHSLAVSSVGFGHANAVTPLQKVIQMLDQMSGKGKQEKHEEEVAFAAFHEWCDQTTAETKKNIDQAAAALLECGWDFLG